MALTQWDVSDGYTKQYRNKMCQYGDFFDGEKNLHEKRSLGPGNCEIKDVSGTN